MDSRYCSMGRAIADTHLGEGRIDVARVRLLIRHTPPKLVDSQRTWDRLTTDGRPTLAVNGVLPCIGAVNLERDLVVVLRKQSGRHPRASADHDRLSPGR